MVKVFIVTVGDTSTCGSRYLKISNLVVISNGSSRFETSSKNTNNFISKPEFQYGQRFLLQDELTGEPLAEICYEVHKNGEVIHGTTDKDGLTELIQGAEEEEVELKIISKEHYHV